MRNYLDYKHTAWSRLYFKKGTDISKIIEKLEQGYLPAELCDEPELGFDEFEQITDTEEYITPKENNNEPTIEVYENSNNECIWNNKNK